MAASCEIISLSSKNAFERLSKFGKRVSSRDITLVYSLNDEVSSINIAFAVGKKVGKAVVRNKIKRRMRAIIREFSTRLPSGDYLLITRPGVVEKSFNELRRELEMILPLQTQCEIDLDGLKQ